jgi:hypothetical protein
MKNATKKKYDGGEHGEPMIYGVRLAQWTATLVKFTGRGWQHVDDHELDYQEDVEHCWPTMGDAAEALWLEGAHPESTLLVWHGTDFAAGKASMLGTAVLSIAIGIVRADDPDDGDVLRPAA